jgi:hypothetical protein
LTWFTPVVAGLGSGSDLVLVLALDSDLLFVLGSVQVPVYLFLLQQ